MGGLIGKWMEKTLEGLFAMLMTVVVLMVLAAVNADFSCKVTFQMSNAVLMLVGVAAIVLFLALCSMLSLKKYRPLAVAAASKLDRAVPWICVALFLTEVYISICIFFNPGWDPGSIWRRAQQRILGDSWGDYFSKYPNNLLLLLGETLLLRVNQHAGIFPGDYAPMACIVVNCAVISTTCFFIYRLLCLLTRRRYALVGLGLCIVLAGLSPWMCVFYSDTLAMIFPVLTIYIYIEPIRLCKYTYGKKLRTAERNGIYARAVAVLVGCIGYFLKPQCIIPVIAIACVEFVYFLKERNVPQPKPRRALRILLLALLAAVAMVTLSKALVWQYESADVRLEREESFGIAHFLMMGLNTDTDGSFSAEDADFSASFQTSAERSRADMERASERLKQMGFGGYLRHLYRKMLMTFHDGTFGWWGEGTFYTPAVGSPNMTTSPALKSLYYRGGTHHEFYKLAAQLAWVTVLFLTGAYGLLSAGKPGKFETDVLKLSIIGITLFLMLFESRARYLFMYIPFFCVLAAMGLAELAEILDKIRYRQRKSEK